MAEKIKDNLDNERLMNVFGRIAILLGLPKLTAAEIITLTDYSRDHLGNYTPQEIQVAVEMAIEGRLVCDIRPFGVLSAKLIQDVMNAYKIHTYEITRNQQAEPEKPTQQDIDDIMKAGIKKLFERYKDDPETDDPNWVGKYQWLVEKGHIPAKSSKAEFERISQKAHLLWQKVTEDKIRKTEYDINIQRAMLNRQKVRELDDDLERYKELILDISEAIPDDRKGGLIPIAKRIKVMEWMDSMDNVDEI